MLNVDEMFEPGNLRRAGRPGRHAAQQGRDRRRAGEAAAG